MQRYFQDPERAKLSALITHYRKRKKDGKPWMPKPSSKLAIYCQEKGIDVAQVITGDICLDKEAKMCQQVTRNLQSLQKHLDICRERRDFILNRGWLPHPNTELYIFCQEYNIDVSELVGSDKSLAETLNELHL